MDKVQRHMEICKMLNVVYQEKNKRYGDSFCKSVEKYGLVAALVRLEDKWNRLHELVTNPKDDGGDESILDTIDDMTNYLIMLRMIVEVPHYEKLF